MRNGLPHSFILITIALLIATSTQLTGCATRHHPAGPQDGPPSKIVNVTKIPNAVPRVEARSKYGNPPSYEVYGKRYHVMQTAKGYHQTGIASWYGMKFQGKRTSSGEPYDLAGMTAAHKSLPLPTYVRVTNLENHKTIIIKVNDRGPFHVNRVIDLTYAGAKKLGIFFAFHLGRKTNT